MLLPQELLPGIWTTGKIQPRHESEWRSTRHVIRKGMEWEADPYVRVLPCGLLNTMFRVVHAFDPMIRIITGGAHLSGALPRYIYLVTEKVQENSSVESMYMNHCTGEAYFHALRLELGPDIVH